ncbi:MAG TPA: TonB-dependent receptor, partial [Gammaproteobacteria bacterium]|nr:TonB-dependent receptor [Gammaproteobacteria bacterium]
IEPLNPSVGVLVDGVDLSNAATAVTLFDIEQIEVFRGPQGTRYGANALAGLINIRTRAPSAVPEAEIGFDAANYDTATAFGALSGPIAESLNGRVAFQHHQSDGFIDNVYYGVENTNERDETSVRGKLRWQPGDDLEMDFMVGLVDVDNGYDAFSLDNDRNTRSDEPGRDAQDTRLASIHARWSQFDRVSLEATVGFTDSDSVYGYDEDWTFAGFHPIGYSSTDYYLRNRNTLTTEIRARSGDASRLLGGRAAWAIGVYALNAGEDLERDYTFAAERFSSRFDMHRTAAFAQLDIDLSAATRLSAGLRFEEHESDYFDSAGVGFNPTDHLNGWRIGLDRTVGRSMMAYALLAGGYKAGGFNTNGSLAPELRTFDPEESRNFEIGLKGDFLNGRLQLRLALFDMDRDEIQIEQSIVVMRSDGSSEFIEYIDNGVSGNNSGLESELVFQPGESWRLHATFGLLRTEFDSYVNPGGDDLSGRDQPHAPEYQYAVSVLRYFDRNSYFELGIEGRDSFFYSSSHNARSNGYTSFNAALGFEFEDWSLRVWGRNLTDEDIHTRGYFFGNDPRIGYAPQAYTQLAEPRRVGLGFTRRF